MCGRFVSFVDDDGLVRTFHVKDLEGEMVGPSWNVAPTQRVRVIVERLVDAGTRDERHPRLLTSARWGLIPPWAKDPSASARLINARAETVLDKPSFRRAALKRRAIIPMDGYYEWQAPARGGGRKTPFYLADPNGRVLAAAGLYEYWRDPLSPAGTSWLMTCSIITTAASDTLGAVHDRTPLLLPDDLLDAWLDPHIDERSGVMEILAAAPKPCLAPRQVSEEVGNVRNNAPSLIAPVEMRPTANGT